MVVLTTVSNEDEAVRHPYTMPELLALSVDGWLETCLGWISAGTSLSLP